VGDLRHPEFLRQKLDYLVREKTEALGIPEQVSHLRSSIEETLARFREVALPHVADTSLFIHRALEAGKNVLFEGAQATLLDIDHGTYPFVTSSHPTAGGASTGSGVGPKALDFILGITKAYITRVGGGPLPTEMPEDLGESIRKKGSEYGASTGRPRRCGWFDSVVVRYAKRINGLDALAITKLDVLDSLEEIQICTHYRYRGERIEEFPGDLSILEECEPVYDTLPGWKRSTEGTSRFEDLPANAKKYLARIEALSRSPIAMISTGPERNATILDLDAAAALDRWIPRR
jgi:adenylosuccinate synthase